MHSPREKDHTLIISVVGGALAGLGIGIFLVNRAKDNKGSFSISSREGLSLIFIILGFIRQISQLGDGNQATS